MIMMLQYSSKTEKKVIYITNKCEYTTGSVVNNNRYTRTALILRIPADEDCSLMILKRLPLSANCAV